MKESDDMNQNQENPDKRGESKRTEEWYTRAKRGEKIWKCEFMRILYEPCDMSIRVLWANYDIEALWYREERRTREWNLYMMRKERRARVNERRVQPRGASKRRYERKPTAEKPNPNQKERKPRGAIWNEQKKERYEERLYTRAERVEKKNAENQSEQENQ